MDRLVWDSEAMAEYIAAVRKTQLCLDEEKDSLQEARRSILRQEGALEDEVMTRVLDRLENSIRQLDAETDRLHHLHRAMNFMTEQFEGAERTAAGGADRQLFNQLTKPQAQAAVVTSYINLSGDRQVAQEWLSRLADQKFGL